MLDAQKKPFEVGGGGFLMNNLPWCCIQYTLFTVDGTL